MDYARDAGGKIVSAEDASPLGFYRCSRPDCGGRVYLPRVKVQRKHFRHYPGEGTTACDEYFPSNTVGDSDVYTTAAVEDDPSELGLLLTQIDGHWGLGLRLPEIPREELGETSLGALRSALVDVYAGRDRSLRVSALELRSGIGAARVEIAPSRHPFRTEPIGLWPSSIRKERWRLECKGFEVKGALFRLRVGEWMRLRTGSQVHYGETLLLLADTEHAPPDSIVTETHARIPGDGMNWNIWELRFPTDTLVSVVGWLARLGYDFVPRPWSVDLITPPRAYGEHGEPVFWVGDSPIVMLESPQQNGIATVDFRSGSNSQAINVRTTHGRFAHVKVSMCNAGLARLAVAGEQAASLDITFVEPPTRTILHEELRKTARLRIRIGEQIFEAWQGITHKIRVLTQEKPLLHVDLGDENVRARVTVFEGGKFRSKRNLNSSEVTKIIDGALQSAEKIEVDAENLGRIVLLPTRMSVHIAIEPKATGRLAWHDYVVSLSSHAKDCSIPTFLEQPRVTKSFAVRTVAPASLVHSRMAIRRRHDSRGSRS